MVYETEPESEPRASYMSARWTGHILSPRFSICDVEAMEPKPSVLTMKRDQSSVALGAMCLDAHLLPRASEGALKNIYNYTRSVGSIL